MRIRNYYRCDYSENLYHTLLNFQIPFDYDADLGWITLYLFEDHPKADEIKSVLPPKVFGEYVFSKSELQNAKWLLMRSTNGKLNLKNESKTFEFSCQYEKNIGTHVEQFARHRKQIAPYEFSTPVKWGHNHFYSSDFGGFYNIFCDDTAMNLIKDQKLTGIQFEPVIAYKKGGYAGNIHQIVFSEVLPDNALILDEGFQKKICPICGREQYVFQMLSRIKVKSVFLGLFDCYRTNDIFGDGFVEPFNIVSNRFYRILTEHGISRNLEFQPLITIDKK